MFGGIGRNRIAISLAVLLAVAVGKPAAAEDLKVGFIKIASSGPTFIGLDKGYFTAEGINLQPVYFETGEPIAVAVTSGDIDIGIAGLTAGLYNLGRSVHLIGGYVREVPNFQGWVFAISNQAAENGLKSYADLSGRSVGISQMGGVGHYVLALITAKYHVDLAKVRIVPLQSNSNMLSALAGNQVDMMISPGTPVMPLVQKGSAKVLGWAGDELGIQIGGIFATAKTANDKSDTIKRFLKAFRRGAQEYHDAFTGPDEKPRDSAEAGDIVALIAKDVGQSPDLIRRTIPYIDGQARLDVGDVKRQIDWYKSQRMVKADVNADDLIDKRYVVPLQ